MLNDRQTSIEFETSREYVKNSPYINDDGIWVPCHPYTLKGTASEYRMFMSKEMFIDAYNRWIKGEDNE